MQFITKLRINYYEKRLEHLLLKVPVDKMNPTKIRYLSKKLEDLGYAFEDLGYTEEQFMSYHKLGIFKIKESKKRHKIPFIKHKTSK